MRDLRGMHWPNSRVWDIEQCLRAAPGCVTVLHHDLFPGPDVITGQTGDVENNYVYGKLRHGWAPQGIAPAPSRLIHIRAYHPNWRELDAAAWGIHIAGLLCNWRGHGAPDTNLWLDPFVGVSLANEQDIEGWVVSHIADAAARLDAYTTIGNWNLTAWRALDAELSRRGIVRRALSVWSALAGGHDAIAGQPDSEYDAPAMRAAMNYCDVLAAHVYGLPGRPETRADAVTKDRWFYMLRPFRPAGIDGHKAGLLGRFAGAKPVLFTEAGTFEHDNALANGATESAFRALYAAAVQSGRVVGITPFIWNSGEEHGKNVIWPNVELRGIFERLPAMVSTADLPAAKHGGAGEPAKPTTGGGTVADPIASGLAAALGTRFADKRAAILAAGHAYGYADPRAHKRIVVHHSAGPREQTVEQIDAFHRTGRGWPGIGYHFVVRQGVVYYVGDVATERAHVYGRNADSIGVCVTGSYQDGVRPADEDVAALRSIVAVLDGVYRPALEIIGHGAAALAGHGTACPGTHLAAVLAGLRTAGGAATDLADRDARALQVAKQAQRFAPNAAAALTKAMIGQGMAPTGDETEFEHGGRTYVCQGGVNLSTGAEAAFYTAKGDWSNVRAVPRG